MVQILRNNPSFRLQIPDPDSILVALPQVYQTDRFAPIVKWVTTRLMDTIYMEVGVFQSLLTFNRGLTRTSVVERCGYQSRRQLNNWYNKVVIANAGRTVADIGISVHSVGRRLRVAPPFDTLLALSEAELDAL